MRTIFSIFLTVLTISGCATNQRVTPTTFSESRYSIPGNIVGLGSKPCVWNNGVFTELSGGVETSGIFQSAEGVYISGNALQLRKKPCFWKNGIYYELSGGTETSNFMKLKKRYAGQAPDKK